ncbi:hypothetical protein VE02_02294 [Pseudogymnoascus sp. 03VT05]|nr:hypothetical protein VE02_02294 [Pseudogymnoascus sp. 03VT05]
MYSPPTSPEKGSRNRQTGPASNQTGRTPNQQPIKQEEESDVIFATKELFNATIKRLEAARTADIWTPPKTDAGKAFSLGIEQELPEFVPMEMYVRANWLEAGEEADEPTEPELNLAVSRSCIRGGGIKVEKLLVLEVEYAPIGNDFDVA